MNRRPLWAAALSAVVGWAGQHRGALTPSGAVGAILVGTSVAGAGGWAWGIALTYFFVSSSLLSRFATERKRRAAVDKFAKGSRRDLGQAFANGGIAATLALLRHRAVGARHPAALAGGFAGALAAATADTWATELGTVSQRAPRLITSGRPVPPGTSGGVTTLGLVASAAGAASLGAVLVLAGAVDRADDNPPQDHQRRAATPAHLIRAALAGGIAGSLADSLLGAVAQAMYWCPLCEVETEQRVHRCGTRTIFLRGAPWLDNDGVNAICTLVGAVVGASAASVARAGRSGHHTRANALP